MYLEKLKKRLRSLVVPYLFWNIFLMVLIILISLTNGRTLLSFSNAITPAPRTIIEGIVWFRFNNAFWFIYALILLVIMTPVIDLLLTKQWLGCISCVFALIIPTLFKEPLAVVFQGDFYSSIFFYFTGCFIVRYYFDWFSKKEDKKHIICSGIICVFFIAFKMMEWSNGFEINEIFRNLILVICSLSFWKFCDCFCEKITLKSFMSHSFMIYALHSFLGTILANLILRYIKVPVQAAIPFYIVIYSLTVFSSLFLSEGLKRKLPKLYGFISGQR